MKRNNKIVLGLLALPVLALSALIVPGLADKANQLGNAYGKPLEYSIIIDATQKFTSAEQTAKKFTRTTALGNEVDFVTNGVVSRAEAEYFCQIGASPAYWLRNSDAITGIISITIVHDLKMAGCKYSVAGGNTYGSYTTSEQYAPGVAKTNEEKTFTFATPVKYFSINNDYDGAGTYIRSMTIRFLCTEPSVDEAELASGDLLYRATDEYDNFDYSGFSEDMRCTSETQLGSGYSAYFHCDANISVSKNKIGKAREDNYPEALIKFNSNKDMSANNLKIAAKFNNAHKWFAITLLDSNGEAVTNEMSIDYSGNVDTWLNYTIARATLASNTLTGKTLQSVRYMKVIMNFDARDEASINDNLPRNVWIDNILLEEALNVVEITAAKSIVSGPTTFPKWSYEDVQGKFFYFEFKYEGGSTSSDYFSLSLQHSTSVWNNVSGALEIHGDMSTGYKPILIADLGNGWKSFTINVGDFNGNGADKTAINLLYCNAPGGTATKLTINLDSMSFRDIPTEYSKNNTTVCGFCLPVDNWKTSGVKVVMDIELIPGSYGGYLNVFTLQDATNVASFVYRPNTHAINQWNGSAEGSAIPNCTAVKKSGEIYTVTISLNDINALAGKTGEESITKISISTVFANVRIYSVSVVR